MKKIISEILWTFWGGFVYILTFALVIGVFIFAFSTTIGNVLFILVGVFLLGFVLKEGGI